jgi:hypothetical protein
MSAGNSRLAKLNRRNRDIKKEVFMEHISKDKHINDFCNRLISTKRWVYEQGKNHPSLKHIAKGGFKTLVIASTPSDNYAYAMMRREYNRYIRAFLIQTGVIYV